MRNLLIRGTYKPSDCREAQPSALTAALRERGLTADALMKEYMRVVFEREGRNLAKTAEAAGVDRRTVRKYLSDDDDSDK